MAKSKYEIVKGHIDLGKAGKFGPGREEEFEKAVSGRKDSKSFVEHCIKLGYLRERGAKSQSNKEKAAANAKAAADEAKKGSGSK